MILTTTPRIEGYKVVAYHGLVAGEAINGINFVKDIGAGIRNLIGGRSAGYEDELIKSRNDALQEIEERAAELGANAVIGIQVDVEGIGAGDMLLTSAIGTAVTIEQA